MKLKTKFDINEEVYLVFKENDFIQVSKAIIKEITIDDNGIAYYTDKICEEFGEDDICKIKDKDLLNKIKKLIEVEFEPFKEEI